MLKMPPFASDDASTWKRQLKLTADDWFRRLPADPAGVQPNAQYSTRTAVACSNPHRITVPADVQFHKCPCILKLLVLVGARASARFGVRAGKTLKFPDRSGVLKLKRRKTLRSSTNFGMHRTKAES